MFEFFSQHPKGIVLFAVIVFLLSGLVNFPGGEPKQLWWACAGACLLACSLIIWGFASLIAWLAPSIAATPPQPAPATGPASATQPTPTSAPATQAAIWLGDIRESILRLHEINASDAQKEDQLRRIQIQVMEFYFANVGTGILPALEPPLVPSKEGKPTLDDWKHLAKRLAGPSLPHPDAVGAGTDGVVYYDPPIGTAGWIDHAALLVRVLQNQVANPGAPTSVKPPATLPHMWTLRELFDSDFPSGSVASELTATKDGVQFKIPYRVVTDFHSRTKLLAFFVPFSPDAFDHCEMLANNLQLPLDAINKSLSMSMTSPGDSARTDLRELTFSGRVFIYHENHFSLQERASLESLFSSNNAAVQFRSEAHRALHQDKVIPAGPLANLQNAQRELRQWSILRENWEMLSPDVDGNTKLHLVTDANRHLLAMRDAVRSLLPACSRLEIEADLLAMACNETHHFFLPGGDRGGVEDRRVLAKTLNALSGHLQPGFRFDNQTPSKPIISRSNPGRIFQVAKGQFGNWAQDATFSEHQFRQLHPAPLPHPGVDPVHALNDYYDELLDGHLKSGVIRVIT